MSLRNFSSRSPPLGLHSSVMPKMKFPAQSHCLTNQTLRFVYCLFMLSLNIIFFFIDYLKKSHGLLFLFWKQISEGHGGLCWFWLKGNLYEKKTWKSETIKIFLIIGQNLLYWWHSKKKFIFFFLFFWIAIYPALSDALKSSKFLVKGWKPCMVYRIRWSPGYHLEPPAFQWNNDITDAHVIIERLTCFCGSF